MTARAVVISGMFKIIVKGIRDTMYWQDEIVAWCIADLMTGLRG